MIEYDAKDPRAPITRLLRHLGFKDGMKELPYSGEMVHGFTYGSREIWLGKETVTLFLNKTGTGKVRWYGTIRVDDYNTMINCVLALMEDSDAENSNRAGTSGVVVAESPH